MKQSSAFSLIEVALALGIVAFAIVGLVALLPIGLKEAKNSTEEIQAINLITVLSSDLKNTPLGKSASSYFNLTPLPWALASGSNAAIPNSSVVTGSNYTFYATSGQGIQTTSVGAHYRVTLQYVRAPGQPNVTDGTTPPAGSPASFEALMTVSWPPSLDPYPTTGVKAQGLVEAYLTFPKPCVQRP